MSTIRILHVDDEPDIREVVDISLGLDPCFETRSCASGQEALAVAEEWNPRIILLDVMMPVMDGAATLTRLRANPLTAGIPVVFMTARAQSRELDFFRSLGAIGVIPKPFNPMTLAASVRAYIVPAAQDRLGAMRHEFLQRVDGDLVKLAGHWSALEDGSAVPSSLAGIRSLAHGLAGAGGIFGFGNISEAAADLEEAVILEDGSGRVREIRSALARVRACVETEGSQPRTHDRTHE